jgi:EpsI family protein
MPRSTPTAMRYGLFAAACLVLVLQAAASRMVKVDEASLPVPGLHNVPFQIGRWDASAEQFMDVNSEAVLKPDEYIFRDYADQHSGANINLFVAYFKSLQNTYGPHSPKICLPGAGWLVSSSKIASVPVPGRADGIPVNQFTMEKSDARILVLYWYQNDRDVWAEEFHAKLRLLPDLIRYKRSDVSLVRLITPLHGANADTELTACREFTKQLFPFLAERFASVR